MLMPERVKWRKQHRIRTKGIATRGNRLSFGDFGLKAVEPGWITSRQIEAARLPLTQASRKSGKMWIRIFPDRPVTKKPAETRMGGGKGDPDFWTVIVKPGRILFELEGVPEKDAVRALRLAQDKLPIKTRIVKREV